MIDLVFLLLVFFLMVSAAGSAGSGRPEVENSRALLLEVQGDGRIVFDGERVEEAQLPGKLQAGIRLQDLALRVAVSNRVEFGTTERILKLCEEAGVESIKLVTATGAEQ